MGTIDSLLNDFTRDLADYMDSFDFSEERLSQIEDRLNLINKLKMKHGKTIEKILEVKAEKEERIEKLQNFDLYLEKLQSELAKAEAQTEEVNMAKAVQDTYQEMLEDKQKEVADNQRLIAELREDRDHYKQGYIEMRNRQDKTEEMVRDLQMQVARNGRMVESMRPFLCFDQKCKKRVLVRISECAAADIEPIDSNDL